MDLGTHLVYAYSSLSLRMSCVSESKRQDHIVFHSRLLLSMGSILVL